MAEAAANREQIAQMIEEFAVQRLLAAAHGVGKLDVSHGGERGQQVELLEDEGDAMLSQLGAFGIGERSKVDAVNHHAAGGGPRQPA